MSRHATPLRVHGGARAGAGGVGRWEEEEEEMHERAGGAARWRSPGATLTKCLGSPDKHVPSPSPAHPPPSQLPLTGPPSLPLHRQGRENYLAIRPASVISHR